MADDPKADEHPAAPVEDPAPPAEGADETPIESVSEDFRFLTFAKRYIALLATVASIPILSSVIEVLPKLPKEEFGNLTLLSSFICLIVFGACFSVIVFGVFFSVIAFGVFFSFFVGNGGHFPQAVGRHQPVDVQNAV